MLTGCAAHKTAPIPHPPYSVFIFTETCKPDTQDAVICKVRIVPLTVRAK